MNHNALEQVTLKTARHTLQGFSISGLATYLQVKDLDVVFDLGECPLSAVPLRHVFLTHAHGDHARCVLRHRALRGMLGLPGEATYFMPARIVDAFDRVCRADAAFEGVSDDDYVGPDVRGLSGDRQLVALPWRKDLFVSPFDVEHRGVPSLGYTLKERRRKLKDEHKDKAGKDIAALRKGGVEVNDVVDVPLLTFIGDCEGRSLVEQAHIWDSAVVVIEATFVDVGEEEMAKDKGHTHLSEIGRVLRDLGQERLPERIVLKHFSMKVTREALDAALQREIPAFALPRVSLLLAGADVAS
jgi:ribonuclease Z